MRLQCVAGWVLCVMASVAGAEVRLPHVLSDHAVLQRDRPVRIWGWATPAESVTVTFHEQTLAAKASPFGTWEVWLRPEKAGGPYTLKVSGDATKVALVRTDILMGEVWLASGQSNMEITLSGFPKDPVKDGAKTIAAANRPNLRLLVQAKRSPQMPLLDSSDSWMVCTPETAKAFSAVAYFFGSKLSDDLNVPVGLIDTTWGGTPAQAWISTEGIAWLGLSSVEIERYRAERDMAKAAMMRAQFAAEDAAAKAAGEPAPTHPAVPSDHASFQPSTNFDGMIAPYVNYTIRGVIWYQGETDGDIVFRAPYYSRVFPGLIADWRKQWGEGDFPFLYVQLASYTAGEGFSIVRDAQRRTLMLRNTGMAVTLDVGSAATVHPPDKQTVGARLEQSALGMVYGSKVETASPMFLQATAEGKGIRAWFAHADGLMTKDAAVGDFEVAGEDMKFVAATATIEKMGDEETVVASAPDVPAPLYVRYGWNPVVKSYLYNAGGLPMGTFTSLSDVAMQVR